MKNYTKKKLTNQVPGIFGLAYLAYPDFGQIGHHTEPHIFHGNAFAVTERDDK